MPWPSFYGPSASLSEIPSARIGEEGGCLVGRWKIEGLPEISISSVCQNVGDSWNVGETRFCQVFRRGEVRFRHACFLFFSLSLYIVTKYLLFIRIRKTPRNKRISNSLKYHELFKRLYDTERRNRFLAPSWNNSSRVLELGTRIGIEDLQYY